MYNRCPVPRLLSVLVSLALVLCVTGAPTWIAELAGDDCAEDCADEGACSSDGCGDCSLVCSSCPRTHVVVPTLAPQPAVAAPSFMLMTIDGWERLPVGPPPRDVFHPPRLG